MTAMSYIPLVPPEPTPYSRLVVIIKQTSPQMDNSRRGRIHSLWNISRTTKATTSCDISNERADSSACVDISGL